MICLNYVCQSWRWRVALHAGHSYNTTSDNPKPEWKRWTVALGHWQTTCIKLCQISWTWIIINFNAWVLQTHYIDIQFHYIKNLDPPTNDRLYRYIVSLYRGPQPTNQWLTTFILVVGPLQQIQLGRPVPVLDVSLWVRGCTYLRLESHLLFYSLNLV